MNGNIYPNDYMFEYNKWKENAAYASILQELQAIEQEPDAIEERFYKNLEFGTGGMRGIIGAGSNRINLYTIRRTTQGLANYLNSTQAPGDNSVVIAYDSRHLSREFSLEAALVLASNGIKTYVFDEITPTPLLSYAVRELAATAGIVITASHNPKEYNGYKVYNSEGGQITDELAGMITAEINKINNIFAIEAMEQRVAEEKGLLVFLYDEILNKYLDKTLKLVLNQELLQNKASELKIVYSPLHGTGLLPLARLFERSGFSNLHIVEKQAAADPDFPTVICPNPEEEAACSLAVQSAREVDADLILVTDPDADRIGMVVKDEEGHFVQLTGNQTGALLIDYIMQMRSQSGTLPANGVIVKTIVTSHMGAKIAKSYGIGCIDVLTGFKYIGEKIAEFEQTGEYVFLFGYEESFGYLIGTHARDKDAIQTALLLAEMALYHKNNGLTVFKRLQQLFDKFGYFAEDLINIQLDGVEGQQKIKEIMESLRRQVPDGLEALGVRAIKDYLTGIETDLLTGQITKLTLPSSNVVYYVLQDGWCCIRPSGTEPKLKIYLGSEGDSPLAARDYLNSLRHSLWEFIRPYTKE